MYDRKSKISALMYHENVLSIDDIRIEIMSRLPLKSLFKFRSINKSWRATIDSSSFRKLHVLHQLSRGHNYEEDSSFLQFTYYILEQLSIMLPDAGKWYNDFPSYQDFFNKHYRRGPLRFSAPVHGLICLYERGSTDPIALCNPFLREIRILPPSAFPCCSPIRGVGLCYDGVGKDFKVVQLSHDLSKHTITVEVYSRKENTWRVLADHPFDKHYFNLEQIKQVQPSSAVVHWSGLKYTETTVRGVFKSQYVIVSLDTQSLAFKTILVPVTEPGQMFEIFAKEDTFIMFVQQKVKPTEELIMWEYKRAWTRICITVPLDWLAWPLTTWKRNGFLLKINSRDDNLAIYDCCSRQIVKYFQVPKSYHFTFEMVDFAFKMVEYWGSFISP